MEKQKIFNSIEEVLNSYDKDDADVVLGLIPFFFGASWEEFTRSYNILGDSTKHPDFQFILADRIDYYLEETKFKDIDLDLICEVVENKYGTL
ncbi:MAG: hypothetical protein ACJAVA_000205 [Flavobacteriaceae bacterium]|jgi:hypothetical protein